MKDFLFIVNLLLLPFCFTNAQETNRHHWKFGVSSGAGYRIVDFKNLDNNLTVASVSPDAAESLYRKLKWAWTSNAEAYYLIKPYWGVGLKYTFAKSSATLNHKELILDKKFGAYVTDTYLVTTKGHENDFFHFVAPAFYFQTWLNTKRNVQLVSSFALGYVRYRGSGNTKMEAIRYPFEGVDPVIKKLPVLPGGHTFGAAFDVGMEYFFHKNWAVGANLSYFLTYRKKSPEDPKELPPDWTISDIDRDIRLDISAGVYYYF